MRVRTIVGSLLAIALVTGGGVLEGAGKAKVKRTGASAMSGAAGAVSSGAARTPTALPRRVDSNDGQGFYCTQTTPNVHYLGTLPPGMGVVIDFESSDTSDPIAILTTLKMEGMDLGAETAASDDADDLLNPRFETRKDYWATYVLAVSTADGDEACYAYRMRIIP